MKQSEGNLKAIFNSSSQFICLMDAKNRLVAFNEKASLNAVFLGQAPFELGRNLMDYAPEAIRPLIQSRIDRALAGESFRLESQYIKPDGEEHWYEVSYNPVYGPQGQVAGVCLMSAPIDERKKSERALRQSEESFRRVFENSAIGICLVGLDAKIYDGQS